MSDRKQYTRKKLPELRIKKHGNKWMVDGSWMGQRPRPLFDTEQEANVWKAQQMVRMAEGKPFELPAIHSARKPGGSGTTLEELYEHTKQVHWLVNGPNGGPKKSWDKIEIAANQAVDAIGRKTRLSALTVKMCEDALRRLEIERDNKPSTTNRRISALMKMFKEGVRQGWMPTILPLQKAPEAKTGRIFRILPNLEEAMLLYALEDDIDFYDFIVLSIWLGHRENETLRIRFSESLAHPQDPYCDGSDFVIFPRSQHQNKTIFTHMVPMRPIVQEVINRRRATATNPTDYVLPQTLTKSRLDKMWARMKATLTAEAHPDIVAQKRDGFRLGQDFVIHIMRNEFCSRLGDEGYDVYEIMKFSGHSDAESCQRYVKPNKVALRQAMLNSGKIKPNWLPGGEVPRFAPTQPLPTPKLVVDNTPPAVPGVDPKVLEALATLQQAGMLDAIMALVTEKQTKAT